MSISRKNWSALSSLARQWTVEDEEEVEREKRRRVKSSTSSTEPEADGRDTSARDTSARDTSTRGRVSESEKSSDVSQGLSSEEQMQVDFMEMLRVRDEKRRSRHVEKLRQQKEEDGDEGKTGAPGGGEGGGERRRGGATVQPQRRKDEDQDSVFKPQQTVRTSSYSTTISSSSSRNNSTTSSSASDQPNDGQLSGEDPDPKPPARQARKFVSSVSISLDKSPSVSGCTSPMSPCSPAASGGSPQAHWPEPCLSPPAREARSPVHNGHARETSANGSSTNESLEQTAKPALIRHSSRTVSFRMVRKKEEESSPLQRSASVRMASKKFEATTDQSEDKDNALPFQRNSKLRTSSKTIQEKLERLAQAAQKSEPVRAQDVTQRTLFRLDEVSRKRGIFEKEQQMQDPSSPGASRQEFKGFSPGMSGRINRWINKSIATGSSHSPADLRQVDISSKRSLFENRENSDTKDHPGKY